MPELFKTPFEKTADRDEFGNIVGTISQIREFFKMGDEITPFLTELFAFLKDLMPLMTEVNQSLHLSTDKLPAASTSISKATTTTEAATFQVMDKLEDITGKLTRLMDKQGDQEMDLIQSIQDDIMETMDTLQFQDIAAQQLEHANRILEAIFNRFSSLFESLNRVRMTSKFGQAILEALREETAEENFEKHSADFHEVTKDIIRNDNVSQDDIDQLFNS